MRRKDERMRRFYASELTRKTTSIELSGVEFRHIKKALRLKEGAEVELFNGLGLTCSGKIASIGKSSATVGITGFSEPDRNESPVGIVLLQGLGKGAKPEFIIQKATELGVVEVCFYTGERSVPDVTAKRAQAKLVRWSRVAIEAAKQCKRSQVPRVSLFNGLLEAMESVGSSGDFACCLLFAPGCEPVVPYKNTNKTKELESVAGHSDSLKKVLTGLKDCKRVTVLIGPEGGFDTFEVEAAERAGFVSVGLGGRVLRTETAAVTALSIVQYELGGMG